MEYIKIKNWDKFQHYSHRNPPWIKLHHTILDDYEYSCLQDASKLLLITLWMLASKTENKIPYDLKWLKTKTMISGKINLKPLIEAGFISVIQDASEMLATDKQNGGTETEKSRDRVETEKETFLEVIFLRKDEYEKLLKEHGKELTDRAIEIVNNYKMAKGKKYKSDYHAILNWGIEEARKKVSNGKQGDSQRIIDDFMRNPPKENF